ncbi:homospermidine synthase [Neoroseomonas oryzicola]|uniref:Homospermidine synthase n=1 Tax=Neoroseomonas oryzicola TaxID=535904 RepID=A0A9X9WD93_9PROT|nr:saccharopine dehydrogenase C-terminal domain-containing protein [Neoroseomonas oryzicola]MBR0658303.1 homospermidine synthase [Neoroseomonas oryzicola]NKE18468.1 homospermidine synthase [Neoroseomonas oryzicola]
MKHAAFQGRLVMLGFGSIGEGVLPLILRHIDMPKDRIEIVTADDRGVAIAAEYGIRHTVLPLTRENYATVLRGRLSKGDFLLNLSVDVSSVALITLCRELGALYLDTCIEPWAGGYTDPSLTPSQRSNYALREGALALKAGAGPTAVTTHGANPGLVSHFVKQALLDIARDTGHDTTVPTTQQGWAQLAHDLGVKVIHIAERDTQVAAGQPKKRGEFVNTWSIDGFTGEGCQPAELGWGTHEKAMPADGLRHDFGCDAAIYLMRPGASTRVRSWTPLEGPMHSFLITHNESISLADYYTLRDAQGRVVYRPTSHYAYHPCDDAVLSVHEFAGRNWELQPEKRLMMEEITSGMDELGVLLMGHKKGAYWYGSRLTIEEARALVPHNNATSLQVCVAVLAGMVFAIENPNAGVVEADELDHARALEICFPYLGEMAGVYSDWTPLQGRGELFPEDTDADPWQFANFRVT